MPPDKKLTDGAQAFALTLDGPVGRISFDAAVAQHLGWFAAARERGLSWNHIVELLRRAGVTRDDGRPLSRAHLSSVYARQRRKAGDSLVANKADRPAAPDALPVLTPREAPDQVRPKPSLMAASKRQVPAATATSVSAPSIPGSSSIRAFMSRAAQQRKSKHDQD